MTELLRENLTPREIASLTNTLGRAEAFRERLEIEAEISGCPLLRKRAIEVGQGWIQAVKGELFEPFVTLEEKEFMERNQAIIHDFGSLRRLLNHIRGAHLALNEAYQRVERMPVQLPSVLAKARDFLVEHARYFQIET